MAMAATTATKAKCPPSRNELGVASWTLMHSVAAHYPENPDATERASALAFVSSLAVLYPCVDCAHGLRVALEEMPPEVDSRERFVRWMCRLHNRVNKELGKPQVPCDNVQALDERWRESARAECVPLG